MCDGVQLQTQFPDEFRSFFDGDAGPVERVRVRLFLRLSLTKDPDLDARPSEPARFGVLIQGVRHDRHRTTRTPPRSG